MLWKFLFVEKVLISWTCYSFRYLTQPYSSATKWLLHSNRLELKLKTDGRKNKQWQLSVFEMGKYHRQMIMLFKDNKHVHALSSFSCHLINRMKRQDVFFLQLVRTECTKVLDIFHSSQMHILFWNLEIKLKKSLEIYRHLIEVSLIRQ